MTAAEATSLHDRREAVAREHMDSENRHAFDVTMATFGHPRNEIVPTGDVYDGHGIAHDRLTVRGRLATVLNRPVTIGRVVLRQARGR